MPTKYLVEAFRYLKEPPGCTGFRGETVVIFRPYENQPPKDVESPDHAPVGPPDIKILDRYPNLKTRAAAEREFQRLSSKHLHKSLRPF